MDHILIYVVIVPPRRPPGSRQPPRGTRGSRLFSPIAHIAFTDRLSVDVEGYVCVIALAFALAHIGHCVGCHSLPDRRIPVQRWIQSKFQRNDDELLYIVGYIFIEGSDAAIILVT